MFLLPINNIVYQTDVPLADVYLILDEYFEKPIAIKNTDGKKKGYYGKITERGFTINSIYRNPLSPKLQGFFYKKENDPLKINVTFDRWRPFFLVTIIQLLFIVFMYLFINEGLFYPVFYSIAITTILVLYFLPKRILKKEIANFDEYLRQTIKATRVEKNNAS